METKTKIKRISTMADGSFCVLIVNNSVEYRQASRSGDSRLYIKVKKKRVYEDQLPIGKEVLI
jgi:hypothetical protein